MRKNLLIGFKGKNNASSYLVKNIAENYILLTNSFDGLKRDIDSIKKNRKQKEYGKIVLFGVDKNLRERVRIEKRANLGGEFFETAVDAEEISYKLREVGIISDISSTPTNYLCNEAYGYALQKLGKEVILIHIPPLRYLNEDIINSIKKVIDSIIK